MGNPFEQIQKQEQKKEPWEEKIEATGAFLRIAGKGEVVTKTFDSHFTPFVGTEFFDLTKVIEERLSLEPQKFNNIGEFQKELKERCEALQDKIDGMLKNALRDCNLGEKMEDHVLSLRNIIYGFIEAAYGQKLSEATVELFRAGKMGT